MHKKVLISQPYLSSSVCTLFSHKLFFACFSWQLLTVVTEQIQWWFAKTKKCEKEYITLEHIDGNQW